MNLKMTVKGEDFHDYLKAHLEQLGGFKGFDMLVCQIECEEDQIEKMEAIAKDLDVDISLEEVEE
ncbi:TPA: hypothetical protein ACGW7H_005894 [Bacillus nitratireducens]